MKTILTLTVLAMSALPGRSELIFFQGWTPLPNGQTDRALGGASYQGNIHIFAVGIGDRSIYENIKRGGVSWGGWHEVEGNGKTEEAPAAVNWGSSLFLFVKGRDGQIYFNRKNGTDAAWGAWTPIPGFVSKTAPAAVVYQGKIHLFAARATDYMISTSRFPEPDTFSPWSELPGHATTKIAVGAATYEDYVTGEGESLFLYGVGIDDRKVYVNKSSPLRSWSGWYPLVGTTDAQVTGAAIARPNAAGFADNRFRYQTVFIKGIVDGGPYMLERGFDLVDWDESFLGGRSSTAITPVVFNNQIHLFIASGDFGIWEDIQRPLRTLVF